MYGTSIVTIHLCPHFFSSRAFHCLQLTAQVQLPLTDTIDKEIRYFLKQRVVEISNIYDMISGRWLCERSGKEEKVADYSCHASRIETDSVQLSSHTETGVVNHAMPADLANADIAHFLQTQRFPT